jgi:hypothetical protein
VSSFAVPLAVTAARCLRGGALRGECDALALFAGGTLALGAVASAVQEGWLNGQSLVWNACALLLAAPAVWPARKAWRGKRKSS